MDAVRAWAPAKLNLCLAILGRRDDGYHELDTVMATVALQDELSLRSSAEPGLRLEVFGPQASEDIPSDARNLAMAALGSAFERARALGVPAPAGALLQLDKRVPSRAGLGGGSSDAAATLRLVEQLLGCDLGRNWRQDWLAGAGSDTVFFDAAGPAGHARCTGRGEHVEPLPALPQGWQVVIVTPDLEASTGAIFAELGAGMVTKSTSVDVPAFWQLGCEQAGDSLRNDLEEAALRAVPGLADWAVGLEGIGGMRFRMTGSGSSFFALCATAEQAAAACAELETLLPRPRLVWSGPFAPLAGI